MSLPLKTPGRPLPVSPLDHLYILRYRSQGTVLFRFVHFNDELPIRDVVVRGKDWCASQNYHFIFIEPAVINL